MFGTVQHVTRVDYAKPTQKSDMKALTNTPWFLLVIMIWILKPNSFTNATFISHTQLAQILCVFLIKV